MAYSYVTYTGNGSLKDFAVSFGYIRKEHIEVSLNGTVTTAFTWLNSATIQMTTAPAVGVVVKILRITPVNASLVNFTDGSTPVASDFNTTNTQGLYNNQELRDISDSTSTLATTANANATAAVTTANNASTAVAAALIYEIVANVAAIPASPANNKGVEVTNSTNIQAFTPLAGLPAGFVGVSGLSVRIVYSTAGATWNFIQYFPNDPENRYLKLSGGTLTGAVIGTQTGNIIPFYFNTYAGLPSASTYHGAVAHAHDTGGLYYAHGGSWVQLAVVGAGGGLAGPISESKQTIDSSYTLSAGYSGLSVGPVAVAAGVSVTVPANAVWAIL